MSAHCLRHNEVHVKIIYQVCVMSNSHRKLFVCWLLLHPSESFKTPGTATIKVGGNFGLELGCVDQNIKVKVVKWF